MRLTTTSKQPLKKPHLRPAALTALALATALFAALPAPGPAVAGEPAAPAATAAQPAGTASADDPLGNLVITPGASRPLPKLGVIPSLSSDYSDVLLSGVIRRDLDLCGEFELIEPADAPEGADSSSTTVDTESWKRRAPRPSSASPPRPPETRSPSPPRPISSRRATPLSTPFKTTTTTTGLRDQIHRLADLLIGALTGQNGGFYSHMAFTSGQGSIRIAYTMDADGHDLKAVSSNMDLAIAAAFG
ncbi:MAG: hypothetical protein R3B70_28940 [Polyangiaceae bacterium]